MVGVQRIYKTSLTPQEYSQSQAQQEVIAETYCPHCQSSPLHRHGVYWRWVSWCSRVVRIAIARFLCPTCKHTVSYLPDFALSYRLVNAMAVEGFFEGLKQSDQVQSWLPVLGSYQGRMERFGPELIQWVGSGLGLAPPSQEEPLWCWLKKACGSLRSATRQLVEEFKITLFHRYQCHQPLGE